MRRAKQLQDLQIGWRDRLQHVRGSVLLLGTVDHLFVQPVLTASRIRDKFRVTHPTALAVLRRLVKEGIVEEQSQTPTGNRLFVASKILTVVEG